MIDFSELGSRVSRRLLTRRDVFVLVCLHAFLTIPPDRRPSGAVRAAIAAADEAMRLMSERK